MTHAWLDLLPDDALTPDRLGATVRRLAVLAAATHRAEAAQHPFSHQANAAVVTPPMENTPFGGDA